MTELDTLEEIICRPVFGSEDLLPLLSFHISVTESKELFSLLDLVWLEARFQLFTKTDILNLQDREIRHSLFNCVKSHLLDYKPFCIRLSKNKTMDIWSGERTQDSIYGPDILKQLLSKLKKDHIVFTSLILRDYKI